MERKAYGKIAFPLKVAKVIHSLFSVIFLGTAYRIDDVRAIPPQFKKGQYSSNHVIFVRE